MSRPHSSQRRQRFTPAQYQPEVQKVAAGRIVSTQFEVVTAEMEAASIAVDGLMRASGPKVKERIRSAMISASMAREWEIRDSLVQSAVSAVYEY